MTRVLPVIVALLVLADFFTLGSLQKLRTQPPPPDLTPRVDQLEKDISQAQQDIGELKQQILLLQHRGQSSD